MDPKDLKKAAKDAFDLKAFIERVRNAAALDMPQGDKIKVLLIIGELALMAWILFSQFKKQRKFARAMRGQGRATSGMTLDQRERALGLQAGNTIAEIVATAVFGVAALFTMLFTQ